jgi:hypothetical protein
LTRHHARPDHAFRYRSHAAVPAAKEEPAIRHGLSSTHIGDPARRHRLFMLAALAQSLLTLLGAASEAAGLDRYLKANASKKRTHSLLHQGSYWYSALPSFPEKRLLPLMEGTRSPGSRGLRPRKGSISVIT